MTKSHNLPALQEFTLQGGTIKGLNPHDSKLRKITALERNKENVAVSEIRAHTQLEKTRKYLLAGLTSEGWIEFCQGRNEVSGRKCSGWQRACTGRETHADIPWLEIPWKSLRSRI